MLLDRQFDRHNFKIVRRIDIRTLDAFGYSLTDSTRRPRTFLEKSGNALHIKTARSRVRQVLLFRPGQPLEPQALAESERLLRQTPEILDARVLVNEASTTRDSVDIEVLTTDVFSITAGVEVGTPTAGLITFGDDNFLGQGHQLENSYRYGRDLPQAWAYQGSYTAPVSPLCVRPGPLPQRVQLPLGRGVAQARFLLAQRPLRRCHQLR